MKPASSHHEHEGLKSWTPTLDHRIQHNRARTTLPVIVILSGCGLTAWLGAGEIVRPDRTSSGSPSSGAAPANGTVGAPPPDRANAAARVQSARDAIAKTRALQAEAAALAKSTLASQKIDGNSWRVTVPGARGDVVVAGGLTEGGLKVREGGVWTGADRPIQKGSDGDYTIQVEVKQNQQQAVLDWESFNIAPNTRLYFNQLAGAENVNNWIAFNRVGVTGRPSAILGRIDAEGQVYVINPNGVLFGGTAQVNAHALVASSLPINDNLVSRGLLNNPDAQFLFSAFNQNAGALGPTTASKPKVTDIVRFPELAKADESTFRTVRPVADPADTEARVLNQDGTTQVLAKSTDYTETFDVAKAQVTVNLTASGAAKVAGKTVEFNYLPTASSSGEVTVDAGARLYAPTTGNNVGGRLALVGKNVSNQGHLSAPDGQIILAAGLEVGVAAHDKNDPSLRGLDVFVGRVTDAASEVDAISGVATNGGERLADGRRVHGLIETRDLLAKDAKGNPSPVDTAGSVLLTGQSVSQQGRIQTTTTVSFNGRVDLNASYGATPNPTANAEGAVTSPFLFGSDGAAPSTGLVELGADSTTVILPSTAEDAKIARKPADGLALRSAINITGEAIHLAGDKASGAKVIATSGDISLRAGQWTVYNAASPDRTNRFYRGRGQVFLDALSVVDASGTQDAKDNVSNFIVEAQLRGSELADSPLQRDGSLRGETIKVDSRLHGPWDPSLNGGAGGYTWVGTPLGDVSGWVNLTQKTAEQLTTAGGTVSLLAGDSVVIRPGAVVDVSAGWTQYTGGRIETTKVVAEGRIFDIGDAIPSRRYDGIFDGKVSTLKPAWGVTETVANSVLLGRYEEGYWEGGNGGKLTLAAGAMALDGQLLGQARSGIRQTLLSPAAGSQGLVARPSQLVVNNTSEIVSSNFANAAYEVSRHPANVYFRKPSSVATGAGASFSYTAGERAEVDPERTDLLELDPDLIAKEEFGFLSVDVSNDYVGGTQREEAGAFGNIVIPKATSGATLRFGAASAVGQHYGLSSLDLAGANISVLGTIEGPGSLLRFHAPNFSASAAALNNTEVEGVIRSVPVDRPVEGRGRVTLGNDASIDVSGVTVDQRTETTSVLAIRGGAVNVSGYQVSLGERARIDVSGGVNVQSASSRTWGAAGSIELNAANEQRFDGATLAMTADHRGFLASEYLRGYSGLSQGGSLRLSSSNVNVIPREFFETTENEEGETIQSQQGLQLSPAFFSKGGFSQFSIQGLLDYDLLDRPAVRIGELYAQAQTPSLWIFTPQAKTWSPSSFGSGSDELMPYLPSDSGRRAPVRLSFTAATSNIGRTDVAPPPSFEWAEHVTLALPVGASASELSVLADDIDFLGRVSVPGGRISLSSRSTAPDSAPINLHLGSKAVLEARGAVRGVADRFGVLTGRVLDGGSVSLNGNLVAESGSLIDVSGASGSLFYTPFELGLPDQIDASATRDGKVLAKRSSHGGSISLTGSGQLHFDGLLRAFAGGEGASGGSLSVSSGVLNFGGGELLTEPNLLLSSKSLYPKIDYKGSDSRVIGRPNLTDENGAVISVANVDGTHYLGGRIATESFQAGGFGQLQFGGRVGYRGPVEISAGKQITLGTSGLILADASQPSSLTLRAPYVALGTPLGSPVAKVSDTEVIPVRGSYGKGTLSVEATHLVDLGTLALRGIGSTQIASLGGADLRANGGFSAAGQVTFRAGQIYAPTATDWVAVVDDYLQGDVNKAGKLILRSTGAPTSVPLSAGASLNLFASTIDHGGVLRAPFGKIRLGTQTASTAGLPTRQTIPTSKSVLLNDGSITSVSAIDYATGKTSTVPIPYGVNTTGSVWIDPTGNDITARDESQRSSKVVEVSADSISTSPDSRIDLSGGGELFVDRWVRGVNGTQDLLDSSSAFAVLPGRQSIGASSSPFAVGASKLEGDLGYFNSGLKVGDSIRIDLGTGAGLQDYTLLPARYALLPGSFLLTPKSTVVGVSGRQPDGGWLTAGYRFNGLDAATANMPVFTSWEVVGADRVSVSKPVEGKVYAARSQYDLSFANAFFASTAIANQTAVRRLPRDAGQLVLEAGSSMKVAGVVSATAAPAADGLAAGRGGEVDISAPGKILITGDSSSKSSTPGTLVLKAGDLNSFKSESLLIGGRRKDSDQGTTVVVRANSVSLENSGTALEGTDIALVAANEVTLAAGATVRQTSVAQGTLDSLRLGETDAGTAAAGLRVSSDRNAGLAVTGGADVGEAKLTVGANAELTGAGVALASTGPLSIHGSAKMGGAQDGRESELSLATSRMAIANSGADAKALAELGNFFGIDDLAKWLVLSNEDLLRYASGTTATRGFSGIKLNSGTSIFIQADGEKTLGAATLKNLTLNAREVRLFGDGETRLLAESISLGNVYEATARATTSVSSDPAARLILEARGTGTTSGRVNLSSGVLDVAGVSETEIKAAGGFVLGELSTKKGSTATLSGDLLVESPVVLLGGGKQTLSVDGSFATRNGAGASTAESVLGAEWALTAESIDSASRVSASAGKVSWTTRSGELRVGGLIDASGRVVPNQDVIRAAGGGSISLLAQGGGLVLEETSTLDVSAARNSRVGEGYAERLGDAGQINLAATSTSKLSSGEVLGSMVLRGRLLGQGGGVGDRDVDQVAGRAGSFFLDAGGMGSPGEDFSMSALGNTLNDGGFFASRSFRLRTGSLLLDGSHRASHFSAATDQGGIVVKGSIDASGTLGGRVVLAARDEVALASGANISVAAEQFNAAGKGGSIALRAGSSLAGEENGGTAPRDEEGRFASDRAAVRIDKNAVLDVSVAATRFSFEGEESLPVRPGDLIVLDQPAVFTPEDGDVVAVAPGIPFQVPELGVMTTEKKGQGVRLVDTATGLASGVVHLRAPRTQLGEGENPDLLVDPIAGEIKGASAVNLEGFSVAVATTGRIDDVKASALAEAARFGEAENATRIADAVAESSSGLRPLLHVRPGIEIVSTESQPSLTLATTWDLSRSRYGERASVGSPGFGESGYLTIRAIGDIALNHLASLSDGFVSAGAAGGLWQGRLLPAGSSSWSIDLVAGADLSAALPLTARNGATGDLLLGKNAPVLAETYSTLSNTNVVPRFFQTVRTGAGDLNLVAARDIKLLNPLMTVYTAGQQVASPTTVITPGDFDLPRTNYDGPRSVTVQHFSSGTVVTPYPASYSWGGGDVSLVAGRDLLRLDRNGQAVSSKQMPTNWLYRRGKVAADGTFESILVKDAAASYTTVASTSWWVDFSNFFLDVGALGGGNVRLEAGGRIENVSAVAPTNARMTKVVGDETTGSRLATRQVIREMGGGNVSVRAGGDISGGVYYAERGDTVLETQGAVVSNQTRATLTSLALKANPQTDPLTWLPTTFFVGKGKVSVSATGDIRVGQAANPFLLPQGINNSYYQTSYFSTLGESAGLRVRSLNGDVNVIGNTVSAVGSLYRWYNSVLYSTAGSAASRNEPWLQLALGQSSSVPFESFALPSNLLPSHVSIEALRGNIRIASFGQPLVISPSSRGGLNLFAGGAISGVNPVGLNDESSVSDPVTNPYNYGAAEIIVSDSDRNRVPGIFNPEGYSYGLRAPSSLRFPEGILGTLNALFADSGATEGANVVLQTQLRLHASNPAATPAATSKALHADDPNPMYVYAGEGDVSGLGLISPKATRLVAGRDVTDVSLYLQNAERGDVSLVAAGRDIVAYNPTSGLRLAAATPPLGEPNVGDIQISGPGSLQVVAGRDIRLGAPLSVARNDGTGTGIVSVGNTRNPNLPAEGASLLLAAGLGKDGRTGLGVLKISEWVQRYLNPTRSDGASNPLAARYLPEMATRLGLDPKAALPELWSAFQALESTGSSSAVLGERDRVAVDLFYSVLRDAGLDHNDPDAANFGVYTEGYAAISTLLPSSGASDRPYEWSTRGDLELNSRSIRTTNGGDIAILTPGGGVSLGRDTTLAGPPPGVVTEAGGNISIFTDQNVDVGSSRIFTLRGGDEIIWSSRGSIAAGVSSKTIQAAPPTRVLVDPQSADVKTDLAGLATGGGIGVLATVAGVEPGDVNLIAPVGVIDAGDAGIRSSGKLNVAAAVIQNASNIQSGGKSSGVPVAPPAPNVGALTTASNTPAAATASENREESRAVASTPATELIPSLVTVEVLGYGGGEEDEDEDKEASSGEGESAPAP